MQKEILNFIIHRSDIPQKIPGHKFWDLYREGAVFIMLTMLACIKPFEATMVGSVRVRGLPA